MIGCDDVRPALLEGEPLGGEAAEHVRSCARCAAEAETASALRRHLAAAPPLLSSGLSARVLAVAAPVLAANARRAARRRLVRAIAAALVPLPLIVALDAVVLRGAYRLLAGLLSPALSLYVVVNYGALLALLLALAYGAVPVLAERQGRVALEVNHV
jgi:hypothetical protein